MGLNDVLRQEVVELVNDGVPQKKIAHKIGMTATTFSRWINGKGKNPPIINADQIDRWQAYRRAFGERWSRRDVLAAPPPPANSLPHDVNHLLAEAEAERQRTQKKSVRRSPTRHAKHPKRKQIR